MPAMAQGPLEEPPGPVSPAWWPARKAATVSSCGTRHHQLRSLPMRGHQLPVQPDVCAALPPSLAPLRGTATRGRNDVPKEQGMAESGAAHPILVVRGRGIGLLNWHMISPICCCSCAIPPLHQQQYIQDPPSRPQSDFWRSATRQLAAAVDSFMLRHSRHGSSTVSCHGRETTHSCEEHFRRKATGERKNRNRAVWNANLEKTR
jgi:hypothetical protein